MADTVIAAAFAHIYAQGELAAKAAGHFQRRHRMAPARGPKLNLAPLTRRQITDL